MTPFPTATAAPGVLLGRLRYARHLSEHRGANLNDRGHQLLTDLVDRAWKSCDEAGLAPEARAVLGIGETG